jgi:hypothetical protein
MLQRDHFVGSQSVKIGRQENRPSRARRRLEAGRGIDFGQPSVEAVPFPYRRKRHSETLHEPCRRYRDSEKPAADIHFLTVKKLGIPPKIASPLKTPGTGCCRPIPPESSAGNNEQFYRDRGFRGSPSQWFLPWATREANDPSS